MWLFLLIGFFPVFVVVSDCLHGTPLDRALTEAFGLTVLLTLYLIPSIVAVFRRHRNALAIFAANVLLGWTGMAWVIVLIWSLTYNIKPAAAVERRPIRNPA
jgi:hypothetical protein